MTNAEEQQNRYVFWIIECLHVITHLRATARLEVLFLLRIHVSALMPLMNSLVHTCKLLNT